MLKKQLFILGSFLLALTTALAAGSYQKAHANERGSFTVSLPSCHEQMAILDVADQGLPKQLLQPNQVQISGSFTNDSTQPIALQIKLTGFPDGTKLNASDSTLAPKAKFSCKPLVSLPSDIRDRYRMVEGTVDVYNSDIHTQIISIPVYIINSNIPDAHPIPKPETTNGHGH